MANEIDILRSFRDEYLLTNTLGSTFVDNYYRFSPPIADIISKYPVMATLVRIALSPVIWIIQWPVSLLVFFMGVFAIYGYRKKRNIVT